MLPIETSETVQSLNFPFSLCLRGPYVNTVLFKIWEREVILKKTAILTDLDASVFLIAFSLH